VSRFIEIGDEAIRADKIIALELEQSHFEPNCWTLTIYVEGADAFNHHFNAEKEAREAYDHILCELAAAEAEAEGAI
jgi:hypothetical protein